MLRACASADLLTAVLRAQVLYYIAPLSTLVRVVRGRDSSSLHLPQLVANAVNVAMWLSYGVVSHSHLAAPAAQPVCMRPMSSAQNTTEQASAATQGVCMGGTPCMAGLHALPHLY